MIIGKGRPKREIRTLGEPPRVEQAAKLTPARIQWRGMFLFDSSVNDCFSNVIVRSIRGSWASKLQLQDRSNSVQLVS